MSYEIEVDLSDIYGILSSINDKLGILIAKDEPEVNEG